MEAKERFPRSPSEKADWVGKEKRNQLTSPLTKDPVSSKRVHPPLTEKADWMGKEKRNQLTSPPNCFLFAEKQVDFFLPLSSHNFLGEGVE